MRLRVNPLVPPGRLLIVADYEHPECPLIEARFDPSGRLRIEPAEVPDGRICYCHPNDEERVRDLFAQAEDMGRLE